VIGRDEVVVCDFGGSLKLGDGVGYCSDLTRTVVTGEPGAQFRELFEVLRLAQAVAVAAATVGTPCEQVDRARREPITAAGYGRASSTASAMGSDRGARGPYMVAGNATPLVAGNAFSIEPGIYLSGRFGARIEDVVIAADDGPLVCNQADHRLAVVEAEEWSCDCRVGSLASDGLSPCLAGREREGAVMDLGLEGRVAVVAASSKGLGRAVADALAGEGARLVISARGEEALASAEAALRSNGADVVAVRADVTDPGTPEHLVSVAIDLFGRLDIRRAERRRPTAAGALDLDDDAILTRSRRTCSRASGSCGRRCPI